MIQIKHRKDLDQVPKENPAYPLLDRLCHDLIDTWENHDPISDGWIVLLEASTNDFTRPLTEIWPEGTSEDSTLIALKYYWEGVTYETGSISFYSPLWLRDNQFGILFLVPDCPELPEAVRKSFEDHMQP